mmetsp:Transcript_7356/g.22423  ORF Transcript_7356/g.22423 Transcript_7356/m.22423 type:complete len:86 (+) Transcript_7356:111-368(+)
MASEDFVEVQFTYSNEVQSECSLVLKCNNWVPLPMSPVDDGYAVTVRIPPGVHDFHFLVDGKKMISPDHPVPRSNPRINTRMIRA